jgi:hypothetical protein
MTTSENNAGGDSNQPPNNGAALSTSTPAPNAAPQPHQLGYRFNGEPFLIAYPQALPIFPKPEDFRSWALWDQLMRGRCITSCEINHMFQQTVTAVLVAKSRDDLGLNILRKASKRIVTHSDGDLESKRNDEYYLCDLHRAHILGIIGGIPAWERMVPPKVKSLWKKFGRRMNKEDRAQGHKEHVDAINLWAAGRRPYSREEKRGDAMFRKHGTHTKAQNLHVPKSRSRPRRPKPPPAANAAPAP